MVEKTNTTSFIGLANLSKSTPLCNSSFKILQIKPYTQGFKICIIDLKGVNKSLQNMR